MPSLSPWGRKVILPLAGLTLFAAGFGSGIWYADKPTVLPPYQSAISPHQTDSVVAEAFEETTILPAKPKNRLTLPDGTSIESDEPITLDVSESGDGATFASSGEARSPGIRTSAGEQALKLALESGVPVIVRPDGTFNVQDGKGGGGSFDLKLLGSRGNAIMLLAGILILCATGYAIYRVFPISRKQAALVGGVGLPLGGILIVGGTNTALFNQAVLAALGMAVVGGLVYAWHMGVFAKTAKELSVTDRMAGKMAVAVDEQDDGTFDTAGNPMPTNAGGRIKRAVRALFKGDDEMESAIDDLKTRYKA